MSTSITIYIVDKKGRGQKPIVTFTINIRAECAAKRVDTFLTRKFANSRVTLVLNDPLLFGQTHTHTTHISVLKYEFSIFSLNSVATVTCECECAVCWCMPIGRMRSATR